MKIASIKKSVNLSFIRQRRLFLLGGVCGLLLLVFGMLPASSDAQSNRARQSTKPTKPVGSGLGSGPVNQTPAQGQSKESADKGDITLNADLVTVVAAVSSREGDFVNDLAASDFEILEDNIPQTINGFSREDSIPLQMAFLFDTSGSVQARREFEKKAAINFFKQVHRPQDRVALFSINTEATLELLLTNKLDHIIDAVNRIKIERGATALYDAVFTAAEYLAPAQGRRVIVIISDGRDNVSVSDLKRALAQAQRADAVVYSIHSFGRALSANVRDPGAEQVLLSLAEQTGGDVYFADRVEDLEQSFRRFAAELHAQYILTYYSTNEARDGRYRNLTVRVKRPGLNVRTRKGYYAPKE